MDRLQHLNFPCITQHITQRGNNRQIYFASEEDYYAYLAMTNENDS